MAPIDWHKRYEERDTPWDLGSAHPDLAARIARGELRPARGRERALVPVSNLGCGRDDLEARVQEAAGAEPAVVFVDMASGSCMFAVLRRLRQRPDIGIVTGVNLAMLVDFVFNRTAAPRDAAARAVDVGEKAIKVSA